MTVYISDPDFTLHLGDVGEVLATLPDESVHCVVTSPPYWGLRDYGTDGQLGLEPTPEAYVARMVGVFREVRRVLRSDGVCWLNVGDSYNAYNGNRGLSGSTLEGTDRPDARPRFPSGHGLSAGGLKPKDLVGIPWRLAFALQADGWYLRSDVIWSKPNPMPESVTDRPTKAHEYLFLLTKSAKYHYDADAIREPHSPDGRIKVIHDHAVNGSHENYSNMGTAQERWPNGGRNKRSVWEIATESYPDAHFATFPQALVEPCVKAGTSEYGCCPECGAPWQREVERTPMVVRTTPKREAWQADDDHARTQVGGTVLAAATAVTTGWKPSCGHGHAPVPCTVLDPFLGSGTTALVARRLGRRSIGIELNADYAGLAAGRLSQLSLLAEEGAA